MVVLMLEKVEFTELPIAMSAVDMVHVGNEALTVTWDPKRMKMRHQHVISLSAACGE